MGGRASLASRGTETRSRPRPRRRSAQGGAETMIQPQETASRSHTFKAKSFKKSKICGICKQVIDSQGISCRVCKYACHRKCEEKVVTPCIFPSNYELTNNSEAVKNHVTRTNSSSASKSSSFSCDKASRQVFLSYFV
ncbi:tensin-1-like isoform X2 [Neopsephotus bourkii]|uniref:tensin-1-like isoform X2 n=1 Tax=Neopsephotus bourkii TaxID=309878 RepID=UPI002AA51510|nr:tensin-1-like isoform X2 [Neopsephotus bourkii]